RQLPEAALKPLRTDQQAANPDDRVAATALFPILRPVLEGDPYARDEQCPEQRYHDILEKAERSMIVSRSDQKQPTIQERIRAHCFPPADSGSLQPSGTAISLFSPAILAKCSPRNGLPEHTIVKNVGRGSRGAFYRAADMGVCDTKAQRYQNSANFRVKQVECPCRQITVKSRRFSRKSITKY